MTYPLEPHDYTQPVTKEDLAESTRSALKMYGAFLEDLPPMPEGAKQQGRECADHLRWLFSDLDDSTLAAFTAYATMNLAAVWAARPTASIDLIALALMFGEATKNLAWSLDTPEAPEPKK